MLSARPLGNGSGARCRSTTVDGTPRAVVKVDNVEYTVGVGDTFAGNFKVVSLTTPNATSGGSPALVGCELYAVGAAGLHAFGAPCYTWGQIMFMWNLNTLPDFNGDGTLNELDLFIALQYVHS